MCLVPREKVEEVIQYLVTLAILLGTINLVFLFRRPCDVKRCRL